MAEKWDGSERREYCAQHCMVKETGKKSVPWRFFVGSMSAVLMIAIAYVGINESRIAEMKLTFDKGMGEHQIHVAQRMADAALRNNQDVERVIDAVGENQDIMRSLGKDIAQINVRLGKAETKQDLILKKIKITE